jgi:hypothetical protein
MQHLVHILVADASGHLVEPITSMVLRSLDEVKAAIARIRDQWKNHPDPRH